MSDTVPGPSIVPDTRELSAGKQFLLDLGPLVLFFLAHKLAPVPDDQKVFAATGVFMVAILVAMGLGYAATRRISTLQLVSAVLVLVMGGLTIWLQSETFIKVKPTLFYLFAGAALGAGLLTGRPLLQKLLGASYKGLSHEGWMKLTRNWALFFVAMAALNEVVWRNSSTDFWIGFKMWGMLPLTFLFAASQFPMLRRHGLELGDEK